MSFTRRSPFLDYRPVQQLRRESAVLVLGTDPVDVQQQLGLEVAVRGTARADEAEQVIAETPRTSVDAVVLVGCLGGRTAAARQALLESLRERLRTGGRLHVFEPNGAFGGEVPGGGRALSHHDLMHLLSDTGFAASNLTPRRFPGRPDAPIRGEWTPWLWLGAWCGAWMAAEAVADRVTAQENAALAERADRTVRHGRILFVILLLALACRLIAVNTPPLGLLAWRQTQTLMVTRNFARYSMNIFRPEVDWRTTDAMVEHGYVGGTELQVIPWLTAWLYRLFGEQFWVMRVFPIAFSVLGFAFLHRLVARLHGERCASLAAFLLALSPLFWFAGRAHMPEPFVFTMSFAALLAYDGWLRYRTARDFMWAVLAATLMLLGKPTFVVMAIPMALLTVHHLGRSFWRTRALYLFAALVAAPAAAYAWYSFRVLLPETGLSFAQPELVRLGRAFTLEYHQLIWSRVFFETVGPAAALTALAGLLVLPRRGAPGWTSYAWAASAVAFFFLFPGGNASNGYYQLMATPPACIFAARAIEKLLSRRALRTVGVAVLAIIAAQSLQNVADLFRATHGAEAYACGTWLNENLPKNARVLTLCSDTNTLYYADRIGWTCWREHFGKGIVANRELVERTRALGAEAVAIPGEAVFDNAAYAPSKAQLALGEYLNENFYSYRAREFTVYLLERAADLSLPPDGAVFGTPEARKYLRGAWGPNQATRRMQTFVAMPAQGEHRLRFDAPADGRHVVLYLACTTRDADLTLRLDDQAPIIERFVSPWKPRRVDLGPAPQGPRRHTITLEAGNDSQEHAALLYGLALELPATQQ